MDVKKEVSNLRCSHCEIWNAVDNVDSIGILL